MTKFKILSVVAFAALMLTGCATVKSPLTAALYTDIKAPFAATSNANSTKVGKGSATCILGLIATGDASIETASKMAGITKIHHIDEHSTSILGIFSTYEVFVYGE